MTDRYRFLSLLLAALFILTSFVLVHPAQAQDVPDLIPYTLFHDFETGELFGWEPYPYAQDTGFEAFFFTRQSPTYNDSNYALARPISANDTVELYHGFTRRLNMWTNEQTRFQAKVFFQSDRRPEQLEVALGTFDGRLFTHVIESPEANEWIDVDLSLDSFHDEAGRPLRAGEHIEVVKLEANYPIVYYLLTYTMLMDNVQLNGERQRRFVATNPQSTDFEEFDKTILNQHYHAGETLSLQVRPEGDAPLDRVRGRLLDSEGRVVREGISFERRGGEWANDSIRRFQSSDARGQWQIELTGERSGEPDLEWSVEFLMPGEPVAGHPRLFFTSEELEERKARLADNPTAQRILENALEDTDFMDVNIDEINEGVDYTGEALTGGPYNKYANGFSASSRWRTPMYQLGNVIREGAFRYAFTGDRAAGEKAKEALLKLSGFEKWNYNWMLNNQFWTYYPVGYTLKPVAYGYDMLYDLMNEEERAFVREAIIEKGLKLVYRDMVEMNRMPSNNTNHMAVITAGHGLAATAIYGEVEDNPHLEPWLSGIITKAQTFIERAFYEDGSYSEPHNYKDMASRSLSEIMNTFERNFGVDMTTTTDFMGYYKYPLHAMHNNRLYPNFGDGGRRYGGLQQVHSEWFVHRTGNPYVYDYVKDHWAEGDGGYMGWLYFRDDIDPISREVLPTSERFDAFGVLMRSGWEDEDAIIAMRVGPHANHYHYDQGSFQVQANGEELLTDPGIGSGGYYANLEFVVYDIHAIAHNVMLVDHDPESQKAADFDNGIAALSDWPEMRHTFTGEISDAIEGDLATVYKDKLADYTRTLLYTKRGPLFLHDRVRSVSPDGHTYNWMFHAPQNEDGRSLAWEEGRMTVDRPNSRLTMDVISPVIESYEIEDRPNSGVAESFIRLNSEPAQQEADFVAVLYPEARTSGARPVTERVESGGWLGAKVTLNGQADYGLFRASGSGSSTIEGFTTDASRFTASFDGSDNLVRYYLEGSSFDGHGQSLSSDEPVTAAVLHHNSGTDVEVDASGSTRLSVSVSTRPSQVTLDGSSVRYSYDNGQVSLQVPAGRHDIEMR